MFKSIGKTIRAATSWQRAFFHWRSLPLAALLLLILAFGLLIPWLGFYFDDWPVILIARLQGARGFWDFYQYDRPLSAWSYIVTAPILGVSPLPWHIFTLLVRWSAVVGMAWCLRGLWPERARRAAWSLAGMALLFAVYAAFDQQPIAVAYNQHWISYALYFLSLGAMIQSVRQPSKFWPFTLLSMGSAILHLLTMNYFLGLELLRPLVLWLILREEGAGRYPEDPGDKAEATPTVQPAPSKRARLKQVLLLWAPYLLLAVAYGVWRLFFLKFPAEDPNQPVLLYDLAAQPLAALLQLLQHALRDLANILFGVWFRSLDPLRIDLTDRFFVFSWTLAALVSLCTAYYLMRLDRAEAKERAGHQAFAAESGAREILWFGLAAFLLGQLPVWVTGRDSLQGLYGGRFALPAMFGASLIWIGLIEAISDRRVARLALVSALVGLAVTFHLQRANEFRWSWQDQARFYWQLAWRAPHLEPGTAVLSDGEFLQYVGRYSTSAALNLLYPQPAGQGNFAYWFLEVFPGYLQQDEGPSQDRTLETAFRSFSFSSSTDQSIVIDYKPETGRCLWVLSTQDAENPELTQLTREAVGLSDLSLIHAEPASGGYPPEAIFGREPAHGWCYYYQKAELARQLGEWEQTARLGDEAQELGYGPNHVAEWLPFIEAYARTGDWEAALKWTGQTLRVEPGLERRMCNLWDRIKTDVALPQDVAGQLRELMEEDSCGDEID
jgi:hypothetical protein